MGPNGRADLDILLGSEGETSKNDQGLYEDDVDEDQMQRRERQQQIDKLLAKEERKARERRKKEKWGKFANITSKEDLEPMLKAEAEKIELGEF